MRAHRRTSVLWTVAVVCAVAAGLPAAAGGASAPPGARSAGAAQPAPSPSAASAGPAQPALVPHLPAGSRLVDTVVSNTDASLKTSDTFSDWEPSIAVDPVNPQHIVILAFSSCWSNTCFDGHLNAAVWSSLDGGLTWTKRYSVTPPPNITPGDRCPCDQTPEYGRYSKLFATFMNEGVSPPAHVFTGSTTDPTLSSAWRWQVTSGTANPTNAFGTDADQPQLTVGPNPASLSNDKVYVAYNDFNTAAPTLHVVAYPTPLPGNPTVDRVIGVSSACCINPGLRLATSPIAGAVYALYEQATFNSATNPKIKVQYRLNRSTDGGNTWILNGSATGIQLASVASDQFVNSVTANAFKFGTVNRLIGGIDSLAVDPTNADVYVVYGRRDPATSKNRLQLTRLRKNTSGGLTAGTPTYVNGQVQSALPSIAIAASGQVGVLYDTFDGFDTHNFPKFSAHLARSADHGATFTDLVMFSWSSAVQNDPGDDHQRVLGDYQQLKTTGMAFYGTFTANGKGLGRPFADADPIFFKVSATPVVSSISPTSRARGATGQHITINGLGFVSGASASFGTGVTVTSTVFNSATKLTATVNVSAGASVGSRNVTVTNPNYGAGTCTGCFHIT